VTKCIVWQVLSAHPERYMPWYLRQLSQDRLRGLTRSSMPTCPKTALGPPDGFDEQMFGAKQQVPRDGTWLVLLVR
jgi:hypothetical protein